MEHADWQGRIEILPDVHHGDPCIKGTRVPVSTILGSLAEGASADQIVEEYPQLRHDDILAALGYAAEVLRHEIVVSLPS